MQERIQLQTALRDAGRRLSTATIRFHRGVAAKLGLNDTDHKCLDLLMREGPMTAGALAEHGGYTSGAVTGIVNRLIAKGFVIRIQDPQDKRKVQLRADEAETRRRMWPLLQPMISGMAEMEADYSTRDLKVVASYLERCVSILNDNAPEQPCS